MPDRSAPWHHWPVAVLTLIFYLIGVLDYSLLQLKVGFYVNRFSPDQLAFATGLPAWLNAVWAVGVCGGLLGGWLLLRRNRFSVLLLFLGFAALTFLAVWTSLFTRPTLIGATGFLGLYLMIGTCALAFLFYIYSRWERTEKAL